MRVTNVYPINYCQVCHNKKPKLNATVSIINQRKLSFFSIGFVKLFIKPGCSLYSINPSSWQDSQNKTMKARQDWECAKVGLLSTHK